MEIEQARKLITGRNENRGELIARYRRTLENRDYSASEKAVKLSELDAEIETVGGEIADITERAFRDAEQREVSARNPVRVASGPRQDGEARFGLPLASDRSFSEVAGVKPASAAEAGEYFRALLTGEHRGMVEGTDSKGGYLVPDELSTKVIDLARGKNALMEAGATIFPMQSETLRVAKIVGDAGPVWRSESEALTASEMVIGAADFKARSLGVLCKVSYELMDDAPNLGQVLSMSLAGAFATKLDAAGLGGSGVAPEPLGVLKTPQVPSDRVGVDYPTLITAKGKVKTAKHAPNAIILNTDDEAMLAGKTASGSGTWLGWPPYLDDLAKIATPAITAGTAIIGDFTLVGIGIRHTLRLIPLRERFMDTGEVGVAAFLRADIQVIRPDALRVITPKP